MNPSPARPAPCRYGGSRPPGLQGPPLQVPLIPRVLLVPPDPAPGRWPKILAAALPALLLPLRAWCATPDVDALLKALARPAPASTEFVEVHFSRLLARPLVVSGRLEYLGPDALARNIERPYRERTEIRGDDVTVQRTGAAVRRFSLQHAPDLKSLLSSFTALLGGDRQALEQQFELRADGDGRHWSLELAPRDAQVRARVPAIDVDGTGGEPRCIITTDPNGNATVMLLAAAAGERLPPAPDLAALRARCAEY